MLASIREFINKKPWIGWIVAGLLLVGSVLYFLRTQRGTDPYSPDRMTEMVTIRFTDTNEEIEMTRGQMDKELRRRGDKIDPAQGIINPKTGQPTGFLFNKSEWEQMIARINREKEQIRSSSGKTVPPAPRKEPAPQPPADSSGNK